MSLSISNKRLAAILESALEAGATGCHDERDGVVKKLLADSRGENAKFRYYTLSELRRFPNGRKIVHALQGDGEVVVSEEVYGAKFADAIMPFSSAYASFWSYPILDSGGGWHGFGSHS